MYCKNCGAEIGEDMKFCGNCGMEVAEEQSAAENNVEEAAASEVSAVEITEEPQTQDVQETVETEEEIADAPAFCENCGTLIEPDEDFCTNCGFKKGGEQKNFKSALFSVLKKVNIPVVVAIVLIVSLVAFAAPGIKNLCVKTFSSPVGYFKYVVNNGIEDTSADIADLYSIVLEKGTENFGIKGDAKISAEEGLKELLGDLGFDEAYDQIDWLKDVQMDYTASSHNDRYGVKAEYDLNGEDIVSFDIAIDMKAMEMYMGIPELNDTYIYTDMDPYDYYGETMESVNKILEILPDDDAVEDILCRYMKCLVDGVEKVEESKETIQAGNISQKVTALTATIDGDTVLKATRNALKELKKDKDIKKIIKDLSKIEESAVTYDEFVESIDYALEDLKEAEGKDVFEEELEITIYANNSSEITGIDFEYGEFKIEAYTAEKGSKFGTYLRLRAADGSFGFEGSGKRSGDKVSGDFTFKVMGVDALNVSLEKLDTDKLKDGVTNGKLILSLNEDVAEMAPISNAEILSDLSIVIDGNSKSIDNMDEKIIIEYNGKECVKVTATAKESGAKKVSIPKNYVDSENYDEMEKWEENVKTDKLVKALKKAGVPGELTEELEQNLY